MLPRKTHQLARSCVPAGDVIACLLAVMTVIFYDPFNYKYALQPRPFLLRQPGNIGCFTANSLFYASRIFLYRFATLPLSAVNVIFKKQPHIF